MPSGYEIGFLLLGSYVWIFVPMLLLGLAVPYVMLRARDMQQEVHDPQLGIKTALHLIGSIGILLVVNGFTIIVVDWISDGLSTSFLTEPTRIGLALVMSGGIISAAHWWFLFMRTNDRHWPAVRRTFVGCRLIIHGLVVCVSLTGMLICLFLTYASEEATKFFGGTLLVWFASWAVHFGLMHWYTKQKPSPTDAGLCGHCGYDLRGSITQTSRACPECGLPISAAARSLILQLKEDAIGRRTTPTPGTATAPVLEPIDPPPPSDTGGDALAG